MNSIRRSYDVRSATVLVAMACGLVACGGSTGPGGGTDRVEGQSDFISSPPSGSGFAVRDSSGTTGGGGNSSIPPGGAPTTGGSKGTSPPDRKVEETDLYRLEGDRLYYINGYRGLMVFDVANINQPKLLGRSAIFGSPVEMIVRNGVAIVVVADWYGRLDDGSPFHGSVVRGLDATDPTNIRLLGDAKLGGWVRDTRVVGDVIYAVSEEYDWRYGWEMDGVVSDTPVGGGAGGGSVSTTNTAKAVVSSVSFAGNVIQSVGRYDVPGYGGIFNVTPNAILFAHDVIGTPNREPCTQATDMSLDYIDISDPGGVIAARGGVKFAGHLAYSMTDNGRWNLDFADGKTAHVVGSLGSYCSGIQDSHLLATADFSNPDAPSLVSKITLPANGWSPAVRFDRGRMYLAPGESYSGVNSPIQIFDLSNPAAPRLAGQTQIAGSVWNFTPAGDRLFTLGNERDLQTGSYSSKISVSYLDVTDASRPVAMGAPATFGEGWAWTPAAGTFKAFTKNDTEGLVVLPFSGWSTNHRQYNNGLQLIEFTQNSIGTSGAARTKGWVERGVFVKGRLVSLSDISLAVVDYSDHAKPAVVAELTLARNVVDARPRGETIAQLSSDWYFQNDQDHSELRILPIDQAEENVSGAALHEVAIQGVNARVYHNGALSYVVSNVQHEVACPPPGDDKGGGGTRPPVPPDGTNVPTKCYEWREQVQVVDFASGSAVLRGKVELPDLGGGYGYSPWGFRGCGVGDWYYGEDAVQVGDDVLAFRRWAPYYWSNGTYADSYASLYIVDLANPDEPGLASTVITRDRDGWWGNMKAIGTTLYTSHYDWHERPATATGGQRVSMGSVRYYLDRIDLSDRKNPRIGSSVNVPGMLVGGSETDPSLIYTVDFRWFGDHGANEFDVLRLSGNKAVLQSSLAIPGNVGNTFVRGNKAYMSVQQYLDDQYRRSTVKLYQLDLSNPRSIVARTSEQKKGWGWLLGVEGDRALVTSGWGSAGLDIYKLSDGEPQFDQFVRTLGYSPRSTSRQGDQIFLASGQWGVQAINLK